MAVSLLVGATAQADWRTEADARIERYRKSDYVIRVLDNHGQPATNATLTVRQVRSRFAFGTSIAGQPASTNRWEQLYWQFVRDHFNTVVCEDAMKWYTIGKQPGPMNFAPADQLMSFAETNRLAMRGHCLFWSKQKFVPAWIQRLSASELRVEVDRHLEATVGRYKGRLIAWDVYNEMLDGRYYESVLGDGIAAHFFQQTRRLDPSVPLFVNEYNILDSDSRTEQYIALIRRLQKEGAPVGGIGIQEHAAERLGGRTAAPDPRHPERAYMEPMTPAGALQRLDRLAELGLPIHLTEISSCSSDPQQRADGLENLFRLGFSHPRVEAILIWGFWQKRHFLGASAALVDADWKLTPAGERLTHLLLREWRTNLTGQTDQTGTLRFRGFHGTYLINDVTVDLEPGKTEATVRLP